MAHVRIFKHYVHVPYIFLGIVDACALIGSFLLTAFFRYFGDPQLFASSIWAVVPSALAFAFVNMLVMLSVGTYQAKLHEGLTGMMLRTILSALLSLPLLLMVYFVFSDALWYLGGQGVLSTASVFGIFSLGVFRAAFFSIFKDESFRRRVLVLGAGSRAQHILRDLSGPDDKKGFYLIGFVPTPDEALVVDEALRVSAYPDLLSYAMNNAVDEIVVAVEDRRKGLPMDQLLACKMEGMQVTDCPSFMERESRKVALEVISPAWLIFSDGFSMSSANSYGKRAIDVLASALLLAVSWPIMLLTMIAIKLEDGWRLPVLYSQERVGLNNKPFYVHKFRSMRTDAEKEGQAVWASKNDARVTRVGEFIRKVRIDELPQIFNVLKGEMSFVGPRPERPVFVERLSKAIPYYTERHRAKPGITGWAQMCFAYADNEEDSREKLRYDLYYIKNQSLLLDLLILLQTVEVILFKKGSR